MNKEQIVERLKKVTNGGFDIFYRLYKDNRVELKYGENIGLKNILKKTRRNSIHIHYKDGKYSFTDGLYKHTGDAIRFAALYYKIDEEKDFHKLISRCCKDLDLDFEKIIGDDVDDNKEIETTNAPEQIQKSTNVSVKQVRRPKTNNSDQQTQLMLFGDEYDRQKPQDVKHDSNNIMTNEKQIKDTIVDSKPGNNGTTYSEDSREDNHTGYSDEIPNTNSEDNKNALYFPKIPDSVYHVLPKKLLAATKYFEKKAERDVFFLGCLTFISTVLPNYSYLYDGDTIFSNIYYFVIGTPASGKGVIKKCLGIVKSISSELEENYNNLLLEAKKNGTTPDKNFLIMSANASKRSFVETLNDSDSTIIFETELDNLLNSYKQYSYRSFCATCSAESVPPISFFLLSKLEKIS